MLEPLEDFVDDKLAVFEVKIVAVVGRQLREPIKVGVGVTTGCFSSVPLITVLLFMAIVGGQQERPAAIYRRALELPTSLPCAVDRPPIMGIIHCCTQRQTHGHSVEFPLTTDFLIL